MPKWHEEQHYRWLTNADEPDDREYNGSDDEEDPRGITELLDNLRERENVDEGTPPTVVFAGAGYAAAWKRHFANEAENARRKAQDEEGWGEEAPEEEAEVGMGHAQMPMCPACGWEITNCDVHTEADLKIIRKHEAGEHETCDPGGCLEAGAALDDELERLYGGEVDPNLYFEV
jgi:hypothetical protein